MKRFSYKGIIEEMMSLSRNIGPVQMRCTDLYVDGRISITGGPVFLIENGICTNCKESGLLVNSEVCMTCISKSHNDFREFEEKMGINWERKIAEISIGTCTYCNSENVMMLGKDNPCTLCVRECIIQHQARNSWLEKNGDPVQALRAEVADLKQEIADLKLLLAAKI